MPLRANGRLVGWRFGANSLPPDTAFEFVGRSPDKPDHRATSRTLPDQLSPTDPFVIALGSCYFGPVDKGRVRAAFRELTTRPRLRFLVGDQVYTEGHTNYLKYLANFIANDPPQVFDLYRAQWADRDFLEFIAACPTCVLPDDHEFWNDFPHNCIHMRWTYNGDTRERIKREANEAFEAYQRPLNGPVSSPTGEMCFHFKVDPLNFLVVDTRIDRTRFDCPSAGLLGCPKVGFLSPTGRTQLEKWARELEGPGVLVMADLLADSPGTRVLGLPHTMPDTTLADYPEDFLWIWKALIEAPHDVLVLAGDVHYARFGRVNARLSPLYRFSAPRLGTVYECVSSALSLLPTARSKYGAGDTYTFKVAKQFNLEYENLFHTGKGEENFALLSFRRLQKGVEFRVEYRKVESKDTKGKPTNLWPGSSTRWFRML